MFGFDVSSQRWLELSDAIMGAVPSPRLSLGFTAVDGALYAYGGVDGLSLPGGCRLPGVSWVNESETP